MSNFSDEILAELPENGLRGVEKVSHGFGAYITREILNILANDSRITRIDYSFSTQGGINENSAFQNKSIENKSKTQSFFQKIINFFRSLFRWK